MTAWVQRPVRRIGVLPVVGMLAVAAAVGRAVPDPRLVGLGLTAAAGVGLGALGLRSPRRLLPALVVWLAVLGLVRRVAGGDRLAGVADPLLLVGPLLLVVAFVAARGTGGRRSHLADAVLLLQVLFVLSAFNPLNGSPTAGFAALLFAPVPMLAFWIGRGIVDATTYERVLRVVGLVAVLTAAYGLFQTFNGFPTWDATWIERYGYTALRVRGVTRGFSTFTSSADYAAFTAIGLVAWFGLRRVVPIAAWVPFVGVLGAALLYIGSRGAVVLALVGLGTMAAARLGLGVRPALALGALGLALLPTAVGWMAPTTFADERSAQLLAHQVEGLSDPLAEDSSLYAHLDLVEVGLRSGLQRPLGSGLGTTTLAGSRFGGATAGTEADLSNVTVALGLPGFAVFVAVLVLGFRRAYALARLRRGAALAALGLLVVTSLQWLNGGQYAVCWLVWLTLGWVDGETDALT